METTVSTGFHKPITPGIHGLIDYAFALSLVGIPLLTDANKKTRNIYFMLAGQVFLYSAFTKQPYALKRVVPMPTHQKIDIANLCGLALLSVYKGIAKQKATLGAHLGLTALGVASVLLTDWKRA
jgi:hypothetical protein